MRYNAGRIAHSLLTGFVVRPFIHRPRTLLARSRWFGSSSFEPLIALWCRCDLSVASPTLPVGRPSPNMVTRLLSQPGSAQAADPFKGFEIERVLSDSDRTKTMAVLGRCAFSALRLLYPLAYVPGARDMHRWSAKPEKAVLLLSRRPFHQSGVQAMLDNSPKSELQFQNDIYAKVQTYVATLFLANFCDNARPVS